MKNPIPYRDARPWGEELWLTRETGSPSMVKIITVNPHEALSLQRHQHRDEYWRILEGNGKATIGSAEITLTAGQDCFVPRGTIHRIESGSLGLVFLELAFGDFDEEDIERLADKYGRADTQ